MIPEASGSFLLYFCHVNLGSGLNVNTKVIFTVSSSKHETKYAERAYAKSLDSSCRAGYCA